MRRRQRDGVILSSSLIGAGDSGKGTAPNVAGDQCQKSMRVFMFASWRLTGAFRDAVGKRLGRDNDGTCQRDGGGGEPGGAELVACLG